MLPISRLLKGASPDNPKLLLAPKLAQRGQFSDYFRIGLDTVLGAWDSESDMSKPKKREGGAMPATDGEILELQIENGNCRDAAHQVLGLLAYPERTDSTKRRRFRVAAQNEYLRLLLRSTRREAWRDLRQVFNATERMPAQQANNALRLGMRRVGHRLAAAQICRHLWLSCPPGERQISWDQTDVNSVRVAADGFTPPSVLSAIRDLAPHLRRVIPVGGLDDKAIKNIQDRILRSSYPVLHIANALLSRALAPGPERERVHWASRLLIDPTWVFGVAHESATNRDAHWLLCRDANIIFPHESLIGITIVERSVAA